MKIYVISGGPGVGKSSVIDELEKQGYKVLKEAARKVWAGDRRFSGKPVLEIDKKLFQEAIFEFQKKELELLKKQGYKGAVFCDRGLVDTLAYYRLSGLAIEKDKLDYVKKFRYSRIFILDFLGFYQTDRLRNESEEQQKNIHNQIIESYRGLGYKIISVPFMAVKKRVEFIRQKI